MAHSLLSNWPSGYRAGFFVLIPFPQCTITTLCEPLFDWQQVLDLFQIEVQATFTTFVSGLYFQSLNGSAKRLSRFRQSRRNQTSLILQSTNGSVIQFNL